MKKENSGIEREKVLAQFYSSRFDSIQILRGIAALFVVAEHIRFLHCGAFGVDIFFCISGLIILFTTYTHIEHFLARRWVRIFPLYALMTMAVFTMTQIASSAFAETQATEISLIKSLCFIPFDVGAGVIQPLVRVGWTLNCEMFFYLIFWISFHISYRYRAWICSGFLVLIVSSGQLIMQNGTVLSWLLAPLQLYGIRSCWNLSWE